MGVGDYVILDVGKFNIPTEGMIEKIYYLDDEHTNIKEIYLEAGYIKELDGKFCKVALLSKDLGTIDIPVSFVKEVKEIDIVKMFE